LSFSKRNLVIDASRVASRLESPAVIPCLATPLDLRERKSLEQPSSSGMEDRYYFASALICAMVTRGNGKTGALSSELIWLLQSDGRSLPLAQLINDKLPINDFRIWMLESVR
jgi:hypothetical protein